MNTLQAYVVDDDADVRKALVSLLQSAGYPAQGFASAETFLDALAGNIQILAGCLILDLRMPGMDGLALQHRLVEAGGTIPILFLTGHGEVPDAVAALRSGAVDFLLKPVDGKLLLKRLATCWQAETERVHARQLREQLLTGLRRLTGREREILRFALQGIRNGVIAERLGLSLRTVEAHRSRLLLKLDADSVQDWQRRCEEAGLPSARLIELLGQ
jgi:FixJ family two-component response regulator